MLLWMLEFLEMCGVLKISIHKVYKKVGKENTVFSVIVYFIQEKAPIFSLKHTENKLKRAKTNG